jgi:hypothetical protein
MSGPVKIIVRVLVLRKCLLLLYLILSLIGHDTFHRVRLLHRVIIVYMNALYIATTDNACYSLLLLSLITRQVRGYLATGLVMLGYSL